MDLSVVSLIVLGCVFVVFAIIVVCFIQNQKRKLIAQKKAFEIEKEVLRQEWEKTLGAKDAKMKSLENELKFLNNEDLHKNYQEAQNINKKLQAKNQNLESEVLNLNAELEKQNSGISALNDKIKDSENGLKRKSEEIGRIETELRKISASNADLQEKLKKVQNENKSLKNDVEDLEDDIEKSERERKIQKEKISSLNNELDESRRECKKKTEKIAEVAEKLNGAEAKLSIKEKSLEFVQEILTAKENPDNTTREHRKVINQINSFMNDYLFGLMRTCDPSGRTETEIVNLKNEFDVWQNLEKKHWLKNKRTIAFVGEFSAGKTSIVNAILLQNDKNAAILPENSKATTAIPTYISNTSEKNSFTFLTPNNLLKTMSESTFKMVDKEVLENVKGASSLIKYFVMSYKNKALNDLSILDTPGFDSNDPDDAMRTIEVINECDALFWVIDVNKGELNNTSIKTIKENLHRPLFVVINKVDTVNPKGVESAVKKIRKTLEDKKIPYEKIILFSKKEKASEIVKLLNSVNKARVEVNAIESIRNIMKKYKRYVHLDVERCRDLASSVRGEGSNTSALFTRSVNSLIKKCETVGDIPSFKSHFFSADVYEMTSSEHADFEKGLDNIKDISKKSKELYEKRMEIEKDIVNRSKDYQDKIQLELKWDDLISIFEKHVQLFNSINC